LQILLVNYLNVHGQISYAPQAASSRPPSPAQDKALLAIHLRALRLTLCPEQVWQEAWGAKLANARLSYQGEVVQRALPLTWAGVRPGLPPEHLSGRCNALDLASGRLKDQLADPALSVLPRELWPPRIQKTLVRASTEEWNKIGTECVKRRIFRVVHESMVIYHSVSSST